MLHFKSCPKCITGTVEHNSDSYGNFLQCLNCGFMRDIADDVSKRSVTAMLSGWRKNLQATESESTGAAA
ncbi:MAG: hypothetical protein V3T49_06185 [Dehalococcoidia bacterium]